ncbi:MAG: integrase core domain-containing protein [Patescibacteria group bacterium]|nr:integrase core domain-containing protein [Patescibacteria group bacterium]
MKYFSSSQQYSVSDVAKFRMKVLSFYDQFGFTATKEAYQVGRSTLFLWKRQLKKSGGSLMSLVPLSTKPKTTRKMLVDSKILEFIHNLRLHNGRFGKQKIKILLDAYCEKEGLPLVSASKVGRIINRNHWCYLKLGRVYHDASSQWAKTRIRRHKDRVSKNFKSKSPGELLQIDTIVRFDLGLKRYILTCLDVYSKFSFAFSYKGLSSAIALDFYQKLELVAPFKVKAVKTDNGLEFQKELDSYLKRKNITHYFSYPHTPKSNAFIERFNRTIQEEFVDSHTEELEDIHSFNQKLINYLLYYNTVRPHQALGYLTPMAFMLKEDLESKKYWTSTRT